MFMQNIVLWWCYMTTLYMNGSNQRWANIIDLVGLSFADNANLVALDEQMKGEVLNDNIVGAVNMGRIESNHVLVLVVLVSSLLV